MKATVICLLLLMMGLPTKEKSMDKVVPIVNRYKWEAPLEETSSDLAVLHPHFRNQVIRFLVRVKVELGIDLVVTETYRGSARQNYLKRRGRSTLAGGRSKHQWGLAVDVVVKKRRNFIWKDRQLYEAIGRIGKKEGLKWGGEWRRFYDPYHFEFDDKQELILPDTVLIPI